jgi:hypothetical protein
MPGIHDPMTPLDELLADDIQASQDTGDLEAMFERLAEETTQPATGLDRLRELPGWARVGMGLALGAVVATSIVATMGLRADVEGINSLRLFLSVAALVGGATVATTLSLRGLHQTELGWKGVLAALLLLGLPAVSALVPHAWEGVDVEAPIAGCMAMGGIASALVAGVVVLLSRWRAPALSSLALAGSSGGLIAFATQQLYCPAVGEQHLLIGHAGVGVVTAIVLVLAGLGLRSLGR